MIDWGAFLTVFVTSIVAACVLVTLYSLGIRFLATPPPKPVDSNEPDGPSRDDEDDDVESLGRPRWATIAAYVCFGLSIVGVLCGILLIVLG